VTFAPRQTTKEPPIVDLVVAKIIEADKPWSEACLPLGLDRIHNRLQPLSDHVGDAAWLDCTFSAGDLMMAVSCCG
jgi:glutathione S-transferase